jgi:two-component system cell cycle sensor histidine kinase/response regulator CckA
LAIILVVDDDPDVNEMAALVLAKYGHDVLSAEHAHAALDMVMRTPAIDLMVTDVVMPVMDGVTLSRHVHEIRPDLPVIFVSGYVDGILPPDGALTAFLRKPWRAPQLAAEVEKILSADD